jgi:hypothetical protein
VDVERQMSAVNREILLKGALEKAPASTRDRLEARPEKTVMHDQEVNSTLDGGIDRPRGGVNGRPHPGNSPGILELKAVQSMWPIGDFAQAQMLVRVGNDLSQ